MAKNRAPHTLRQSARSFKKKKEKQCLCAYACMCVSAPSAANKLTSNISITPAWHAAASLMCARRNSARGLGCCEASSMCALAGLWVCVLYVCNVRVSQIIPGRGEERQAADEDWQAGVETSGPLPWSLWQDAPASSRKPRRREEASGGAQQVTPMERPKVTASTSKAPKHHVIRVRRMQSFHIVPMFYLRLEWSNTALKSQ